LNSTWFAQSTGILNLFRLNEFKLLPDPVDREIELSVASRWPYPVGEQDTCIPVPLIGYFREARRNWRKIATIALKDGSWENALAGVERIPIDLAPGNILLEGPLPMIAEENVLIYLIRDELFDAKPRLRKSRVEADESERTLLLAGARDLWFLVGFLGGNIPLLPSIVAERGTNGKIFSQEILWCLMRRWRDLVGLSPRFALDSRNKFRWPHWGSRAFNLAAQLNITVEEIRAVQGLTPLDAGQRLGRLLIRTFLGGDK
jgi:hypothetical protein